MVLLSNKSTNSRCVLGWRARKLKRVVSSSTNAEALAVNDVLDELVFLKEILKEIFGGKTINIPLEVYTDSKNLHRAVNGTSLVDNPRLRIEVAKV